MKTILTFITLLLVSITTFSQTSDITKTDTVDNITNVYTYLKTNAATLKSYTKDFSYHTESRDTLYLQRDCDLSLLVAEIWKKDEVIEEEKPHIVLHPNVSLLIKTKGKR